MTDKLIVSRSEIEALQRFDDEGDYGVRSHVDGDFIKIDDLRALLDKAEKSQAEPVLKMALDNTNLKNRIKVLEDLLSSAYNIANRNGEDTNWIRFSNQLHINGINPITPKTFKILPSDDEYNPPADKQDAERYRTIRKSGNNMRVVFGKYPDGINIHASENHLCGTALDEAIDEAMKGE